MAVDTYCQITFISAWMIHKLHKLTLFLTELITPPHPHLFPFYLLLSRWLAWADAKHHQLWLLSISPHTQSIISLSHLPWQNFNTHLSTLSHLTTTLLLVTITFSRRWRNKPLKGSPWTQSSSLSSGSLSAEWMSEEHYTHSKTEPIVYVKAAEGRS